MKTKHLKRPKYFTILVIGFVIWIAETAYFGFNDNPENGMEAFLDVVSFGMIFYGLIGDLLTNVRIQKHYHNTTNINTKKVQFQDEAKIASYNVKMRNSPKDAK